MGNAQLFANEFNRIQSMRSRASNLDRNIVFRTYHYRDLASSFIRFNENQRREAVSLLGGSGNMEYAFWRELMDRGFDITPFRRVFHGNIHGPV